MEESKEGIFKQFRAIVIGLPIAILTLIGGVFGDAIRRRLCATKV